MKTLLIIGTLLVGMSGQALSMGHPHNMFAARKQLRTKVSAEAKMKPSASFNLLNTVRLTKATISEHLLSTLSQLTH